MTKKTKYTAKTPKKHLHADRDENNDQMLEKINKITITSSKK